MLLFLFCLPCSAQINDDVAKSKLFSELAEDEKTVARCERERREYQISKYGKVLPKISGHCYDGDCPTSIVTPYYPLEAKRLQIKGQVKVETIVNESGKVIYAKVVRGSTFLSLVARRAAYLSSYKPKVNCDGK
ncbi:MAG: TonB family protein, partial [Pyrinomonadaceae bacterium]|nr:TonB family protein [Pyrinomonadaceae bacterium]